MLLRIRDLIMQWADTKPALTKRTGWQGGTSGIPFDTGVLRLGSLGHCTNFLARDNRDTRNRAPADAVSQVFVGKFSATHDAQSDTFADIPQEAMAEEITVVVVVISGIQCTTCIVESGPGDRRIDFTSVSSQDSWVVDGLSVAPSLVDVEAVTKCLVASCMRSLSNFQAFLL
jgi:hypothetical protein